MLHMSCDVALIHLLVEGIGCIINGARTEVTAYPSTPQSTSCGHVCACRNIEIME